MLRRNNRREDRKGGKNEDPWLGPYVIFSNTGGIYKLRNKKGEVLKKAYNGCNLKLYTEYKSGK